MNTAALFRFRIVVLASALAGFSLRGVAGDPPPSGATDGCMGMTGDWFGARPWLVEQGVTLTGSYQAEIFGNVHGGLRTGAAYEGLLQLNLDLDAEKIAGWSGATLHSSIVNPHGTSLTQRYVGDLGYASNIDAYDSLRLYEVWVEQKLFDKHVSLRAGFLAADSEFSVMDSALVFINSSFGVPTVLADDFPMSSYPLSALGVRLCLEPAEGWCVKLAVYDGNPAPAVLGDPTPDAAKTNEFNHWGTHFALRGDEGAMLFAEVGWRTPAPKDGPAPLTTSLKLGGTYHTDRFADIRDTTLQSLGSLSVPADASSVRGNFAIYGSAERELWRRPGTTQDGLGAVARATFAPPGRNFFRHSVETGLVFRGLWQSDARDTLGLGVAWLGLSPGLRDAYHAAGQGAPRDEVIVELTYQCACARAWNVQPDLQWIIHPGGNGGNALVIGLRTTLNF